MVEEIRNSEFDDVLKSKLAVVDFSAVWCGPCQMLAPILEELSDEMDGEADFYSADVDENRDLAYQFDIQSIPAIVIFSNGEEVERTVGFMPKDELKAFIKSAEAPTEPTGETVGATCCTRRDCEKRLGHRVQAFFGAFCLLLGGSTIVQLPLAKYKIYLTFSKSASV